MEQGKIPDGMALGNLKDHVLGFKSVFTQKPLGLPGAEGRVAQGLGMDVQKQFLAWLQFPQVLEGLFPAAPLQLEK